jgi:hypothetical protein
MLPAGRGMSGIDITQGEIISRIEKFFKENSLQEQEI